jgi:hypothetical protein
MSSPTALALAEGVGFEPTKVSLAGFQDRCTRPLCEPSVGELTGLAWAPQNSHHLNPIAPASNESGNGLMSYGLQRSLAQ